MTTSTSETGAPVRVEMPAVRAPFVCTVLMRAPWRFERPAIEQVLAALPAAAGARLDRLSDDATKMRLVVGGRLFVVGMIARPMPRLAFARTLAHPGSAGLKALIEAHEASLVVTCPEPGEGTGEAVMAAVSTHLLVAELGALGTPLGGFWGASERLCDWAEFEGHAGAVLPAFDTAGPVAFPTRFWMSVQLAREGDRIGGRTMGLLGFTGYEVEMAPLDWPAGEVAAQLVGVVAYLFQAGPVLK